MDQGGGVDRELVVQSSLQMMERAAFALVVAPPVAGQLDRMLQIVGNSALPESRRIALEDTLVSRDALRGAIGQAFDAAFGDASREAVLDLVNDVWHALVDGAGPDAEASSLASGASTMVSTLSEQLVGAELAASTTAGIGPAMSSFCGAVAAAAMFEEEEEGYGVNPVLGGDGDPLEG